MADTELFHETALSQPEPGEEPRFGDPEEGGDLLEMEEEQAIDWMIERWDSQTPVLQPLIEQWKVNVLRRKGIPGVRIRKGECYLPKGATADSVPSLNKLADTNRRLMALLFSDPPASDAIPDSDSDEDKEAAEAATQMLEDLDSESQLNDAEMAKKAMDRGSDYGSGFEHFWVDPKGGARVPVQIQAGFDPTSGERAVHVSDAVYRPDPLGIGMQIEWPEYESRFVRPDGSLTDEKGEAATKWAPKIRSRVYTSKNVRFLPITADGIWEADGVLITDFPSWGELLTEYAEELDGLSDEDKEAILSAKPKQHTDLMSAAEQRALKAKAKEDKPVWRMILYLKQSPAYPQGAHLVVLGGKKLIVREAWVGEMADGSVEPLDIPLTQYGHLDEGGRGGAYRVGMTEILGGANELRGFIWAQVVHNLERLRNQAILLPRMGKIHPKMMKVGGRNVLPFAPGYKPESEDIPALPSIVLEAFERVSAEMDDASGLQQAARGLEDPSVSSGRHAFAIISQVKQGLSGLIQSIEKGWVRAGRIKLQLVRAFYTNEQQLLWFSDDDEWKMQALKRADLRSTRDVRLKAGTLTMLSPAQKEAAAIEWFQMGLIDRTRLDEIVAANLGATLGIQQDPRRSRMKRQLNRWLEGPPETWEPPQIAMQPEMQPVVDPVTGAVIGQEPVVQPTGEVKLMGEQVLGPRMVPALDRGGNPTFEPDPVLSGIFQPVPSDIVPRTAQLRFDLIADVMNSKAYLAMHPAWRSALDQEFYRMQDAVAQAAQAQGLPRDQAAEGDGAPQPKAGGTFSEQQMEPAA